MNEERVKKILQRRRTSEKINNRLAEINDDLTKTGRYVITLRSLTEMADELTSCFVDDTVATRILITLRKIFTGMLYEIESEAKFEDYMLAKELEEENNND